MMSQVSILNDDLSIKIPVEILRKTGIKPGTEIIWACDEHGQIILMEKPKNFAKALRGLGKEIWYDTNIDDYVKEERETWE